MSQELWTSVDTYFNDYLVPSDPVLEAALADSDAANLTPAYVAPNQGKLLQLLAQMQQAKTILELGTLGGYSTIWLARALPDDGHLISLELDPKHVEVARANLQRAGLADHVEVRLGKAVDSLAELAAEGRKFDLIFIDADKPSNPEYLAGALKVSHQGSVIIVDNVVRNGAVINDTTDDPNVHGVTRLVEMVKSDPRLSATAIQTVGSKGYDGFMLAIVNSVD